MKQQKSYFYDGKGVKSTIVIEANTIAQQSANPLAEQSTLRIAINLPCEQKIQQQAAATSTPNQTDTGLQCLAQPNTAKPLDTQVQEDSEMGGAGTTAGQKRLRSEVQFQPAQGATTAAPAQTEAPSKLHIDFFEQQIQQMNEQAALRASLKKPRRATIAAPESKPALTITPATQTNASATTQINTAAPTQSSVASSQFTFEPKEDGAVEMMTPRDFMLQIATAMNKRPEQMEKFISALEDNMIESAQDMMGLSGQDYKDMGIPILVVKKITQRLQSQNSSSVVEEEETKETLAAQYDNQEEEETKEIRGAQQESVQSESQGGHCTMVEFVWRTGVEVHYRKDVLIDLDKNLTEVREILGLSNDHMFLSGSREVQLRHEGRTSIDQVMEVMEVMEQDADGKNIVNISQPHAATRLSPHAIFLERKNNLDIYLYRNDGAQSQSIHSAKVLIVLGATGSGKTTLLNTLVTYCLGVKRQDTFRYTIVDERDKDPTRSVTSEVTRYYIEPDQGRYPYPILIFDTPGFGDTSGVAKDEEIYLKIKAVLEDPSMIDSIHSICFVANSTNQRLTASQEYIMQKVTAMFGKDVAENFVTMATFCDGGPVNVKQALENDPSFKQVLGDRKHILYKFQNSATFADPFEDQVMHEQFWNISMTSIGRFINDFLSKIPAKDLHITRDTLEKRQRLELSVRALQVNSALIMAKKIDLENQLKQIAQFQNQINSNKSFKITTKTKEKQTKMVSYDVTQCNNCFHSCHEQCIVGDAKERCGALRITGKCVVCPGKCPVSAHVNSTQVITMVDKVTESDDKEMKKRYCDASSKKSMYVQIKEGLQNDIKTTQVDSLKVHLQIQECFEKLDKVALVTNVYQNDKYFDQLIKAEENKDQTPETLAKLKELRQMKKKEKELSQLYQEGRDRKQVIQDLQLYVEYQQPASNRRKPKQAADKGLLAKITVWVRQKFLGS